MRIIRNKLVVFGAGKIGRSFIGQIFGTGGYEVVFIDLNKALIEELNARGNYNVVIKSGIESVVNIKNVREVYVYDRKRVVSEVASAGIVAVSVGLNGLTTICPLLAEGLMERYRIDSSAALDILIA